MTGERRWSGALVINISCRPSTRGPHVYVCAIAHPACACRPACGQYTADVRLGATHHPEAPETLDAVALAALERAAAGSCPVDLAQAEQLDGGWVVRRQFGGEP